MHVSIHVGCVRKIILAPFCTAQQMDDFCLFYLVVVHKAWTTSALLPRCAPIYWHVSMKRGLLLNTSIAKLSFCIWTTKAFCPSFLGFMRIFFCLCKEARLNFYAFKTLSTILNF